MKANLEFNIKKCMLVFDVIKNIIVDKETNKVINALCSSKHLWHVLHFKRKSFRGI